MKVYRLENPDRIGPFTGSRSIYLKIKDKMDLNNKHLTPERDGLDPYEFVAYYFGCDSMETLKLWFYHEEDWNNEFKQLLIMEEYKISVYETEHYKVGYSKNQIAFNLHTATLLETFPVEYLYN